MSNITLHYNSDTSSLTKEATVCLSNYLGQYKGRSLLLLLSGGSALQLLGGIQVENVGEHVTVGVLDERFSEEPDTNNFAQVMKTDFYTAAKKQGCRFIDSRLQKNETQDQLAQRFEDDLRTWKESNPDGVVIATQGIGPDGHTSGIMPFPEDKEFFKSMFEGDRWVVGYDAKDKNPHSLRVTTTITFLRDYIDVAILYVTGESKKEVLRRAMHESVDLAMQPSVVIQEMKRVELFTDLTLDNE